MPGSMVCLDISSSQARASALGVQGPIMSSRQGGVAQCLIFIYQINGCSPRQGGVQTPSGPWLTPRPQCPGITQDCVGTKPLGPALPSHMGGMGNDCAGSSTAMQQGKFHGGPTVCFPWTAKMTPAGLEPAIPGSVGRCLIHWATGPVVDITFTRCYWEGGKIGEVPTRPTWHHSRGLSQSGGAALACSTGTTSIWILVVLGGPV